MAFADPIFSNGFDKTDIAFLPHDTPTAIAMSNSYQTPDRVTTQNSLFFARYFNVVTHHVTSLKQLDSTGVVIDASSKIITVIFTGKYGNTGCRAFK